MSPQRVKNYSTIGTGQPERPSTSNHSKSSREGSFFRQSFSSRVANPTARGTAMLSLTSWPTIQRGRSTVKCPALSCGNRSLRQTLAIPNLAAAIWALSSSQMTRLGYIELAPWLATSMASPRQSQRRVSRSSKRMCDLTYGLRQMLLGVWFFGPFCMMVSASFSGGGLLASEAWRSFAPATLLFVPYTFVMSTYDATLGALLVVTIWFFVIDAVGLTVASDRLPKAPAELCVSPEIELNSPSNQSWATFD